MLVSGKFLDKLVLSILNQTMHEDRTGNHQTHSQKAEYIYIYSFPGFKGYA